MNQQFAIVEIHPHPLHARPLVSQGIDPLAQPVASFGNLLLDNGHRAVVVLERHVLRAMPLPLTVVLALVGAEVLAVLEHVRADELVGLAGPGQRALFGRRDVDALGRREGRGTDHGVVARLQLRRPSERQALVVHVVGVRVARLLVAHQLLDDVRVPDLVELLFPLLRAPLHQDIVAAAALGFRVQRLRHVAEEVEEEFERNVLLRFVQGCVVHSGCLLGSRGHLVSSCRNGIRSIWPEGGREPIVWKTTHHVFNGRDHALLVWVAVDIVVDLARLWWVVFGVNVMPRLRPGHFSLRRSLVRPFRAIGNVKGIGGLHQFIVQILGRVAEIHSGEICYSPVAMFSPRSSLRREEQEQ